MQRNQLKKRLVAEKQACLELEMRIESMQADIPKPPAMGNSKLICGNCHLRGHRNNPSRPCIMAKCDDYTKCGLKEKHPDYFASLNVLKTDLRKKKASVKDLQAQITSMEDFSKTSEFDFMKNLTPRLYAIDPSYKTNKGKLMRDCRLLRDLLDGKIPPVTANDAEQLSILISKCKRKSGIQDDYRSAATPTVSPVKYNEAFLAQRDSSTKESSHRSKKRKHKKHKKSKRRRHGYCSDETNSSGELFRAPYLAQGSVTTTYNFHQPKATGSTYTFTSTSNIINPESIDLDAEQ